MPAPRKPYLFRRHSSDCRVRKLKLSTRRKAAFMDCDCPVWAAGRTATGEIPRQSTGTRDLKTAEAILAALVSTDNKKHVDGPTIEDCVQKYLAPTNTNWARRLMDSTSFTSGDFKNTVSVGASIRCVN